MVSIPRRSGFNFASKEATMALDRGHDRNPSLSSLPFFFYLPTVSTTRPSNIRGASCRAGEEVVASEWVGRRIKINVKINDVLSNRHHAAWRLRRLLPEPFVQAANGPRSRGNRASIVDVFLAIFS